MAGLLFAVVTVFVFPTTTVSLYCNKIQLEKEGIIDLFQKIYFLTFPLGMVCVLITGYLYSIFPKIVRSIKSKICMQF